MRLTLVSLLALAMLTALPLGAQDGAPVLGIKDAPAGTYVLDPAATTMTFRIVHFGLSDLPGRFTRGTGELVIDQQSIAGNALTVWVETASAEVNSRSFQRIMLGRKFFDAANHPTITFSAANASPAGGEVTGALTMRGITAPVTLNTVFNGYEIDPLTGQHALSYSAQTTVDRRTWGMTAYQWMAGSDVEIQFDAVFIYDAILENQNSPSE